MAFLTVTWNGISYLIWTNWFGAGWAPPVKAKALVLWRKNELVQELAGGALIPGSWSPPSVGRGCHLAWTLKSCSQPPNGKRKPQGPRFRGLKSVHGWAKPAGIWCKLFLHTTKGILLMKWLLGHGIFPLLTSQSSTTLMCFRIQLGFQGIPSSLGWIWTLLVKRLGEGLACSYLGCGMFIPLNGWTMTHLTSCPWMNIFIITNLLP